MTNTNFKKIDSIEDAEIAFNANTGNFPRYSYPSLQCPHPEKVLVILNGNDKVLLEVNYVHPLLEEIGIERTGLYIPNL